MPKMPSHPPSKMKPNFSSRNGAPNSSFGIASEQSAETATTTTVIGLTRLAETAASPMISPPTIPIVPPSGPGMRTPASRISSKSKFHQKNFQNAGERNAFPRFGERQQEFGRKHLCVKARDSQVSARNPQGEKDRRIPQQPLK